MEIKNEKVLCRVRQLQADRSVNAFAVFLGVNQKTLDHFLKGERKLSIDLLFSICSKSGVSADWVLGIDEKKTSAERAEKAENKLVALKRAIAELLKEY